MRSKVVRRGLSVLSVAGMVVLAACSSTSTQVSDEIATQVKDELDLSTEPGVTCPDGAEAGKGETFTCDIDLDDGTVPVKVTFKDDTNFTSTVQGAVYKKSVLDSTLKTNLGKAGVTVKSIACKGGELVVFKPKGTVTCTATADDDSTVTFKVGLDKKNEAVMSGALYETATLESGLSDNLGESGITVTTLDCGDASLIAADADTTIECSALDSNGTSATLEVALGADGNASIENIVTE